MFQPGLSRLSLNTNKCARSTRFDTYRRSGSSFPWNQFLCQSQELIFNCHCQNLYQILCVSIGGRPFASLHLAHLTFYAGQEDAALAHLKEHLSWRVQGGRDTCAGCGQTRGEDTPMLTCSGCRAARFCSADHQKKHGFEKGRIGRESDDRAAQGYLRSAPQAARCGQRRCCA